MKIWCVEKLGLTVFQPLGARQALALWTVSISAAVIEDALVVTAIAALDMASKCCGSTQFDRTHDAPLCSAQRGAMGVTIACAVAAEHIRHFQPRAGHRSENQKCFGGVGSGLAGTGCGSSSRGLEVAQTLLVAIRKYLAVVARLR